MSLVNLYKPNDFQAVTGIVAGNLLNSYRLMDHIDFRQGTFQDGAPAWIDSIRPYAEYGSGKGILRWNPKMYSGAYVKSVVYDFIPNTWYYNGQTVWYANNFWYFIGDEGTVVPTPAVGVSWQLYETWVQLAPETGYPVGARVRRNGLLFSSWTNNNATDPLINENLDWEEVVQHGTQYAPTPYTPRNAEEAYACEVYMGSNGYWGGVLSFGAYAYGTANTVGTTAAPLYGYFDFNGFKIYNMYMDRRVTETMAGVGSSTNNPSASQRAALIPYLGIATGDPFNGSTPNFDSPCILSTNSSSVVYSTSYSTSYPDPMTGGIVIRNGFVLNQNRLGGMVSNNNTLQILGDVDVEGRLVNLMLRTTAETTQVGFVCGNYQILRLTEGDVCNQGNIRVRGSMYIGRPAVLIGGLYGRINMSSGLPHTYNWGNIDVEVDIEINGVSGLATGINTNSVGLFVGHTANTDVTLPAWVCNLKNVLLKGSVTQLWVEGQPACNISGLLGKNTATCTFNVESLVAVLDLSNQAGDCYAICFENLGVVEIDSLYYVGISGEIVGIGTDVDAIPHVLTLDGMKIQSNFTELDFDGDWIMSAFTPMLRDFTLEEIGVFEQNNIVITVNVEKNNFMCVNSLVSSNNSVC